MNKCELRAGYRMTLADNMGALKLKSGSCEVYAATKNKKKYRQIFLMEATLDKNNIIFPAYDEFNNVELFIYAIDDCVLNETDLDKLDFAESKRSMKLWFHNLSKLDWISRLADLGDDVLQEWGTDSFLDKCTSIEDLHNTFREHQSIFSMLLGTRFKTQDKKLELRTQTRELYKRYLLDRAVGNLILEDSLAFNPNQAKNKNIDSVIIAVRNVTKYLKMQDDVINIAPEIAKSLDQISLMRRLFQKACIHMRMVELNENWYKEDCGTLIGYFGEKKEVVALLPIDEKSYKMVGESYPEGILVTKEIASRITENGFQCYAGFPARKLKIKDLITFIIDHAWKRDYYMIIFISFIAGIIPICTPIITETVFSDIIPIQDRQGLVAITQFMIISGFAMAALGVVRNIAVMRLTSHIDMNVEGAMWGHLLSLPVSFFRKYPAGELLQRMNGVEVIKNIVSGEFVGQVFNVVFSFWSILLMLYYSLKLAGIALAIWAVYMVVLAVIYRRIFSFQRKQIEASNKTVAIIQQLFNGLAKFRVRGAEEQAYYLWSKVFGESWKWNMRLVWQGNYNSVIGAVQPFILTLVLYYMAVYGLEDAVTGRMGISYPEFMAFQAAFSSFNASLIGVIPLVVRLISMKPHIDNLRPILEEEPEVTEDKIDADVLTGDVEVSHLTFSYGKDMPDVLKDVSFKVKPHEKVAIVGKSGCGKSTLIRLLLGMEKPKSGAIYYDESDLAELNMPSVRSQMGVVIQNGQLMTGDIFHNIVGATSLTMDDAWLAAEMSGAAEDIRNMPMGMYTVISEGSSNISGGQRQRILIARALANRPAIMILDEATSALDNRTQAIVTKSLEKLQATQIVVAHRLSTIRNADKIIVMDEGEIVEQGSYDELMALDGYFAKMAKRQIA